MVFYQDGGPVPTCNSTDVPAFNVMCTVYTVQCTYTGRRSVSYHWLQATVSAYLSLRQDMIFSSIHNPHSS